MTTPGGTPKYSLEELEREARVPLEQQVAEQASTGKEPAISEYQLRLGRLLGIEHAG